MVLLLSNPNHGGGTEAEPHRLSEDMDDSTCSTPYVSAPSSPGRYGPSGYFFSAPASPMHYVLSSSKATLSLEPQLTSGESLTSTGSFEFEFSSRFSSASAAGNNGSMSSADELFLNGQIRPMKLSSHLQRPQFLAPLLDLEVEDEDNESLENPEVEVTRGRDLRLRNRSLHRKTRSLSPLRTGDYFRQAREITEFENTQSSEKIDEVIADTDAPSVETTPSGSASSSRSSSSGRNSKKWIFLKDLLYRSKSEGRGNTREKFWSSISFSQSSKEKKLSSPSLTPSSSRDEKEKTQHQKRSKQASAKKSVAGGKPANGVSKRRVPLSAHERHYTTNRAQAEEMKKKTFLPYRHGVLGCLGFSSKGYGALSGFTRTLNPVSSR